MLTTTAKSGNEDPLYWLLPSLSSVIEPHALEKLSIQLEDLNYTLFDTNWAERLMAYNLWAGLDSILTRPVFPQLRSVEINIGPFYSNSRSAQVPIDVVRSQMPALDAVGALKVVRRLFRRFLSGRLRFFAHRFAMIFFDACVRLYTRLLAQVRKFGFLHSTRPVAPTFCPCY